MALIKCNECGKEISDKAKSCIHCGCPIEPLINNEKQNNDSIKRKTSNNNYYEKEFNIKTIELDLNKIKNKKNICVFFIITILLVQILGFTLIGIELIPVFIPTFVVSICFGIMFFNFKGHEKNELILTNKRIKGKINYFGTLSTIDIPLDKIDSIDVQKDFLGVNTIVIRANSNVKIVNFVKNCDEFRSLVIIEIEKYKKYITK